MSGFIVADAEFIGHSRALDAASETLLTIFGKARGSHARTAVGVESLPSGCAVEIQIDAALL